MKQDTVIIRAVHTVDAMTATIAHPDWSFLDRITSRIVNEVKGINRVCYDLTPIPTGSIDLCMDDDGKWDGSLDKASIFQMRSA